MIKEAVCLRAIQLLDAYKEQWETKFEKILRADLYQGIY